MSVDRIRAASAGPGPFLTGPEWDEKRIGTSANYSASTSYTYKGTKDECISKRAEVRSVGCASLSIKPAGDGDWILTASFPGTPEDQGGPQSDPPVDQHELEVNIEQVPWENSVRLNGLIGTTYASKVIGAVSIAVKNFHAGDYKPGKGEVTLTDVEKGVADVTKQLNKINAGAFTTSGVLLFRRLVGSGIEGVLSYNTVYRRTITAASFNQVQAAYTGVGMIWTNTEVENFEGIPTNEWFGLEQNTQWLKSPPHVSAVSGGKTQITYYYTGFKRASNFFYEAYGAATLLDV